MQISKRNEPDQDGKQPESQNGVSDALPASHSETIEDGYFEIEKILDYRVESGN